MTHALPQGQGRGSYRGEAQSHFCHALCWRREGGRKAARVREREKFCFQKREVYCKSGGQSGVLLFRSVPLVAGCRGAPLSLIEGPPASSTSQDRRPSKGDCPRVHLAYT
ncbi:unnamed protein product [Chondrus crispus]|uniref:Uncharacterized protein n=1 Tax=Chondrus crispus TaxID=2769 RepID=R7QH27_CHOCR|nr:unnamed protein product [Chondrus crispus]CDF37827.1 unnamed protein product [Chondrus crispus]|eukprot:XP_005717698.1 unnamed protein product [Chondrus crispus]